MSPHTLVACTFERHAGAILEIFNDAIAHSTALYEYQPRTMERMVAWFDAKRQGGHPVVGVEDADGRLMAFGSYGPFRPFPAFKYTVEHSVYVHPDCRGQGLGRVVMQALIEAARGQDVHVMVGAIDADNAASLRLHAALGFVQTGLMPQVGFKFGRWLNLALLQLQLDTPARPVDG
jgi:phosphinothricin acetyltransferase